MGEQLGSCFSQHGTAVVLQQLHCVLAVAAGESVSYPVRGNRLASIGLDLGWWVAVRGFVIVIAAVAGTLVSLPHLGRGFGRLADGLVAVVGCGCLGQRQRILVERRNLPPSRPYSVDLEHWLVEVALG